MWAAIGSFFSGSSGGESSGGGGGLGYSGQNSSSISTPVTASAGGGVGAQTFNLGNNHGAGINPWLVGGVVLVGLWLVMRK